MALATIPAAEFASVCESGDEDAVKRILSAIASLPKQDRQHHTNRLNNTLPASSFSPIHWACLHNSASMLTALLGGGMNLSAQTKQPLTHSKAGTLPKGTTPLHAAAAVNSVSCAQILLDLGPNAVDVNVRNCYGLTPLFVAAASRNAEVLTVIASHSLHKPDPSAATERAIEPAPDAPVPWPRGANAVMAAAAASAECLQALLDQMFDPWARDDNGYSAVHYACQFGNARALQKLAVAAAAVPRPVSGPAATAYVSELDSRIVKPTVCVKGSSPLHVCVRHCRPSGPERARWLQCIGVLLAAGANPNAADVRGFTPLHIAVMQRDCGVVRLFTDVAHKLKLRLNLNAASTIAIPSKPGAVSQDIPVGTTPYQLARLRQAFDCAEVIVRHLRADAGFAEQQQREAAAGRSVDPLMAFIRERLAREDALAARLVSAQTTLTAIAQLEAAAAAAEAAAAGGGAETADADADADTHNGSEATVAPNFSPAPLPMPLPHAAVAAAAAAAAAAAGAAFPSAASLPASDSGSSSGHGDASAQAAVPLAPVDAEAAAAVNELTSAGALAGVEVYDPLQHWRGYMDAAAAAPSAAAAVPFAAAAAAGSARGTPLLSGSVSPFVSGMGLSLYANENTWSVPGTPHTGSASPWTQPPGGAQPGALTGAQPGALTGAPARGASSRATGAAAPGAGAAPCSVAAVGGSPSSRVPHYKLGEPIVQIPLDGIDGAYADAAKEAATAASEGADADADLAAKRSRAGSLVDAPAPAPVLGSAPAPADSAPAAAGDSAAAAAGSASAAPEAGASGAGAALPAAATAEASSTASPDAGSPAAAAAAAAAADSTTVDAAAKADTPTEGVDARVDGDTDADADAESEADAGAAADAGSGAGGETPAVAMGASLARSRAAARVTRKVRPIAVAGDGLADDDAVTATAAGALRPGSIDDVEAMHTTSAAALLLAAAASPAVRHGFAPAAVAEDGEGTPERSAPLAIQRSATVLGLGSGIGPDAGARGRREGSLPSSSSGLGAALRDRDRARDGLSAVGNAGVGSLSLSGGSGMFTLHGAPGSVGVAARGGQGRSVGGASGVAAGSVRTQDGFDAARGDGDDDAPLGAVGSMADTVASFGEAGEDVVALQRQVRSLQKKLSDAKKKAPRGGGGAQAEQTVADLQKTTDALRSELEQVRGRLDEAESAVAARERQVKQLSADKEAQRAEMLEKQAELGLKVKAQTERNASKDERIKHLEAQAKAAENAHEDAVEERKDLQSRVAELEALLAAAREAKRPAPKVGGNGLDEPLLAGADPAAATTDQQQGGCCCTVQ